MIPVAIGVKKSILALDESGKTLNCVNEVRIKISWIMWCKNSARYIKSTIRTGLKKIVMPVTKKFMILSTLFVVSAKATTKGEI